LRYALQKANSRTNVRYVIFLKHISQKTSFAL